MNRTRNERRERIREAAWMAGIAALLGLIFLFGMGTAFALEMAW